MLLVEDDDETRDYLARTLGRRVGWVYTARNGLEGLHTYSEHQPSAVITDIKMPDMNGIAMVDALRKLNADMPIIVTSGSPGQVNAEILFDLGVTRFIQKPINGKKLIDSIMECVKRSDASSDMRLSASVFDATPLAIIITNKNGEILTVNDAFCKITGYAQDEILGRNPKLLRSGKHDARFY